MDWAGFARSVRQTFDSVTFVGYSQEYITFILLTF